MKIVIINGGRKKGNTSRILNNIRDTLPLDVEWKYFNLNLLNVEYCRGCESCLRNDICPIEDDVPRVMAELRSADGVILASPVHMGNVTGKLKTFIDRTCCWYHRPELIGIPLLAVVSTAGSDLKYTLDYLEKTAIFWGMQPAGRVGRKIGEYDRLEPGELEQFASYIKQDRTQYNPALKQLIHFQVQRVLAEKVLARDKQYWQKKGWLKQIYYYECNINIFKKVIAVLFYKFLRKQIN